MLQRGIGTLAATALVVVAGCEKTTPAPVPITELVVHNVEGDVSKPDPDAPYWKGVGPGIIKLLAQPMIAPRPETTTTAEVIVQAVTDGKNVAFRLKWKDPERSEAGRLGEYSDALALEFPLQTQGEMPPVFMGMKGNPVQLFHWRAQYQRDKEKGKPAVKDLYPNTSVDMYPLEFKEAPGGTPSDREKFSPGVVEGNPQSYAKEGIDEIVAEGFSTSAVQAGHGSAAHGEWKEGEWTLVIVRPVTIEGGSSIKSGGKAANIAFAVWQGGKGEVGARKCVTMQWTPVVIK